MASVNPKYDLMNLLGQKLNKYDYDEAMELLNQIESEAFNNGLNSGQH